LKRQRETQREREGETSKWCTDEKKEWLVLQLRAQTWRYLKRERERDTHTHTHTEIDTHRGREPVSGAQTRKSDWCSSCVPRLGGTLKREREREEEREREGGKERERRVMQQKITSDVSTSKGQSEIKRRREREKVCVCACV